MKKFLNRLTVFVSLGMLPFIILLALYLYLDPFRILHTYDNYYANSFVTLNRGTVCVRLFKRNIKKHNYNSFIFGNSRSLAYKIPEWEKHLDTTAIGFHFDASGEGIFGIYNKIKFIQSHQIAIKNALIVLDYEALKTTYNRMGFIFVSPTELSGESDFVYHEQFLKAYFDPVFLTGYLDYTCFHTYRDYMEYVFTKAKYDDTPDNITGDLYYGNVRMIREDSIGYYNTLVKKGIFYDRMGAPKIKEKAISGEEIMLLKKIYATLQKDNTNYSIVVSPMYDQVKLSTERLELLNSIFGSQHVFDFSGKNEFTNSMYNYYEANHYRPKVANEIMNRIYSKKTNSHDVHFIHKNNS